MSGDTGSLLATPAVARDSGGTLQVAWITFGTPQSLMCRPIAAGGTPGPARTLASGWGSLSNPAIARRPQLVVIE